MSPDSFNIIYTLVVVLLLIIGLITDRFKMSLLFLSATVLLLLGKVLTVDSYLAGFGNRSILTIFLLIIISGSINDNFNLFRFLDRFFGQIRTANGFILKLGVMVMGFSSLINNTTVVATLMPYTYNWANQKGINPSKLLMPLSFLAIAGGMITLIGTSTNLLLNGLLVSNGFEALEFSDFLFPGLLVSFGALLFLYVVGPRFLSNSARLVAGSKESVREYLVETKVLPASEIIGKSVEQANLRNLDGVFLTEIIRGDKKIVPVGPSEIIEEGDIFLFAGENFKIFDLLKQVDSLELSHTQSELGNNIIEAVVSQNSNLDRKTLKEVGFREKYNAAVVGIHRKGVRLSGKLGSIVLHTGDLVLIDGGSDFEEKNNRWQDLIVISSTPSKAPVSSNKRSVFWISLFLVMATVILGLISLFEGLLGLLFIQLLLGMVDLDSIKKNVSLDLFIVLTSSLAIGNSMIQSGASELISAGLFNNISEWSALGVIGITFLFTFILTSFVTNVAALAIMFPIVANLSLALSLPPSALFLTIAFAASCSFLTPFAYQTNLMVTEAGNYRVKDFMRLGMPLSLVYFAIFFTYLILHFELIG